ncbi:hypothetical protein [Streptomyces sp. SPB4]|uniref:hypothetical protein n=1 Tax=Streptomyces sp. SPB4 TaxID=2940553 RepID=UPI00247419E3|nr:hypothetical protein [Streptomyces sp. SPB4]MDH6542948.1 hypothetical protein [Streptomyces sp. SPB4]
MGSFATIAEPDCHCAREGNEQEKAMEGTPARNPLPPSPEEAPSSPHRMFVEIQRADTKATALCGVTGALLAIVVGTALSAQVGPSRPLAVSMALTGLLLAAALVAALRALRPVFPRNDGLVWRDESVFRGSDPVGTSAAPEGQADGSAALTALARRKFRAIKLGVDLTVAGIGVAGLGLLLTFAMP